MITYIAKPRDVHRKWYLADAEGKTLGRFASAIATILRGKHKPIYSPHMDVGDHVVVINADKISVTGKKALQKEYYHYSGYPGGLKTVSYARLIQEKPERVLEHAIKGMLPHNKLGRRMFKKLRIHAGPEHTHQAQKPEPIDL